MQSESNAKDPLGEIERLAKRLWEEKDRPQGTSWKDFVDDAEKQLLFGLSAPRMARQETAIADEGNPLLQAQAMGRFQARFPKIAALLHLEEGLNHHECYCLAKLLTWNEFSTGIAEEFHACGEQEIVELLTILANEYPPDFLVSMKICSLEDIPPEKLRQYWAQQLLEWRAEDQPLGYSDRNTLERLRAVLIRRGTVFGMRLKGSPSALS